MKSLSSANWIYAFVVLQCVSVALLAVESLGGFRLVLRMLPFAMSIAYFLLIPQGGVEYPVRILAVLGLLVMGANLFHPEANTLFSGLAQIGLTLSIWAPVFWAGRIDINAVVFRRVILLLWAFNTISSGFGVLQVYDPDRFAPDPVFVKQIAGSSIDGLLIRLDDGTELFRPMGLSDTPGGAALAANASIVMGIGVVLLYRSQWLKMLVACGGVCGMFCLYLCQVRSLMILTAISIVITLLIMAARGRGLATLYVALVSVGGAVAGLAWSTSIGSKAVHDRLDTFSETSAGEMYYSNRGIFVEETFTSAIPRYPLGAGLGRWGMMSYYFGNQAMPSSPPLWAEITLTGWVYDGGVPLVLIGYTAMLMALIFALRVALSHPNQDLSTMAAVIAAVSVATFATTISAHVFVAQSGMMYLLLNAMLFAVVSGRPGRRTARR